MKKIKKKKSSNLKVYILFLLVIIISLACYKRFVNPSDDYKYQNNIINNTDKEINPEIENLILNFFNTYYRSMKDLKEYDMKKYYAKDSEYEYLINKTALELLIMSRTKELNDLSLRKASYDIEYTKIEEKDNTTHIELKENSFIDFKFMDSTSKIYNILNTFDIIKENETYKIKSFYKEQGQFIMIEELLEQNYSLDEIKERYNKIYEEKLVSQQKDYEEYLKNENKKFKKCDNEYDRQSSISYANKYVIERKHTDYSSYGGNCQNYASWSLYEGGIPMDTTGSYKWKYYGDSVNDSSNKNGRSTSWTGVNQFYTYAKNNSGSGLCSEVDVNTYYAEKGDIIQVGFKDIYSHTTLVVGTVKKDDKVIDILLNSNTTDLENYPLSAYIYPNKRLIKILGWNN